MTLMTLEEAIAHAKANPTDAEAWYALGRLVATAGYPDRARDCFTRAVALDPDARKPGARRTLFPLDLPPWML